MIRSAALIVLLGFIVPLAIRAQTPRNWTSSQLMPPAILAERIGAGKTGDYLVISAGPDAMIPGSIDIGPGQEPDNVQKLRNRLATTDRRTEVIVYCGCCPFDKCPNIRPAFAALTGMGFKNAKVLDIPRNMKVNWIEMGYPVKR